jgi:membrane-anchored protein YejM (alkaline phosphatase superfamily)
VKSTSLHEIKKELQALPSSELTELCLSLAKYKKDNKEFLAYLLFQAQNKTDFLSEVKAEVDTYFLELKTQPNLYYVKKSLRKLLRIITKYSKYLNDKAISADLLIYFCKQLKNSGIPYKKSQLLVNMYEQQLKKINTLILGLHEDLRHDYFPELENLLL